MLAVNKGSLDTTDIVNWHRLLLRSSLLQTSRMCPLWPTISRTGPRTPSLWSSASGTTCLSWQTGWLASTRPTMPPNLWQSIQGSLLLGRVVQLILRSGWQLLDWKNGHRQHVNLWLTDWEQPFYYLSENGLILQEMFVSMDYSLERKIALPVQFLKACDIMPVLFGTSALDYSLKVCKGALCCAAVGQICLRICCVFTNLYFLYEASIANLKLNLLKLLKCQDHVHSWGSLCKQDCYRHLRYYLWEYLCYSIDSLWW